MPHLASLASKFALLALLAKGAFADDQTCFSYGMDFQDQGSYFQNQNSSDPFTFVSQFDGCSADVALNILVDPTGDQVQCSDTNLTPDDTDQLSTCPTLKNQLWTGEWSIVIISNNGDAQPIAYQRDFHLDVGPQSTSTYTPTVTMTSTYTPVQNITTTTTDTSFTTIPQVTVTKPSTTLKPTVTITPKTTTTTITSTTRTRTVVKPTLTISKVTKTITASCKLPRKPARHDPTCTITPTIVKAAALATPSSAKFRKIRREDLFDKAKFVRERHARLVEIREVIKRAPDPNPLVVTETNESLFATTTTTITTTTYTNTITTNTLVTATVTPDPATTTVYSGVTIVPTTITLATPTKTQTRNVAATITSTKTFAFTVTITTKTTPSAVVTSCRKAGGILI